MRRNIPRLRAAIADSLLPLFVEASRDYAQAGVREMELAILKQAAMFAIAHDRLLEFEREAMRANIELANLGMFRTPSVNAVTITYMVIELDDNRRRLMWAYNNFTSDFVSRNLMLAHAELRRLPMITPIDA